MASLHVAGDTLKLLEHPETWYKNVNSQINMKLCKKCGNEHPLDAFKYGKSSCYECQKQMSRDWKNNNKARTIEYGQQWRNQHKDAIRAYNIEYAQANKETIQRRSSKYHTERAKVDFNFKLAKNLRTSLRYLVKNCNMKKGARALQLLGCDLEFLKSWFNYNFMDDMNFDNHGLVWHIDHTIPVSTFNLLNDEELRVCFHWTNLKPMYAKDNMSKKNKLTIHELNEHESRLKSFIQTIPQELTGAYTVIDIDRHSYIRSNRGATKVCQE